MYHKKNESYDLANHTKVPVPASEPIDVFK